MRWVLNAGVDAAYKVFQGFGRIEMKVIRILKNHLFKVRALDDSLLGKWNDTEARNISAKRVEWKSSRRALTSSWRKVGTWQDAVGSVRWWREWRRCGEKERWEFHIGGPRSEGGGKWPHQLSLPSGGQQGRTYALTVCGWWTRRGQRIGGWQPLLSQQVRERGRRGRSTCCGHKGKWEVQDTCGKGTQCIVTVESKFRSAKGPEYVQGLWRQPQSPSRGGIKMFYPQNGMLDRSENKHSLIFAAWRWHCCVYML